MRGNLLAVAVGVLIGFICLGLGFSIRGVAMYTLKPQVPIPNNCPCPTDGYNPSAFCSTPSTSYKGGVWM